MLNTWDNHEELSTPPDHQVVVCDLQNLYEMVGGMGTSQKVIKWSIKTLSKDDRKKAAAAWHSTAAGRLRMRENSEEEDIEQEVDWIEATLTATLDSHTTVLRVTALSKQWWTIKAAAKWKEYGKIRRLYK